MSCEAMKMGAIMRQARLGAATLFLALPGMALAAAAGAERIVAPALPGFVVGYTDANATNSIKEEVPNGETVEAWTRMVTTQRFGGLAAKITPVIYARNIIAGIPKACPGSAVAPVEALTVAGRPAARFQVDCPRKRAGSGRDLHSARHRRQGRHARQVGRLPRPQDRRRPHLGTDLPGGDCALRRSRQDAGLPLAIFSPGRTAPE